jgi:hypothetical protein
MYKQQNKYVVLSENIPIFVKSTCYHMLFQETVNNHDIVKYERNIM